MSFVEFVESERSSQRAFSPLSMGPSASTLSAGSVAYKTIHLPMENFDDTNIPVACWYPVDKSNAVGNGSTNTAQYQHRISVKRIGQLLAGWNFIPDFVSRDFSFKKQGGVVVDGSNLDIPKGRDVIFFAHGYLGSRFDLSEYAECLAEQGYVCVSAEYPESLAASYERMEGLDRSNINSKLVDYVKSNLRPTNFAGVGHSLGCGTVLKLGDPSWTRVLIAGRPPEDMKAFPRLLFVSSTNDCTVRFGGELKIPAGYETLAESTLPSTNHANVPPRAALLFDRPDGPNHISYLSENVNEAMVGFLSPLLPVAQALNIPVLDFDKYQEARDSVQTTAILKPLISSFLNEQMKS